MNLIYSFIDTLINGTNKLIISLTHQKDLSCVRVWQHRAGSLLPSWRGIFSSQLVPGVCELPTIITLKYVVTTCIYKSSATKLIKIEYCTSN